MGMTWNQLSESAGALEARVAALEEGGPGVGNGNLTRKAIAPPDITHERTLKNVTVPESQAHSYVQQMSSYLVNYIQRNPDHDYE